MCVWSEPCKPCLQQERNNVAFCVRGCQNAVVKKLPVLHDDDVLCRLRSEGTPDYGSQEKYELWQNIKPRLQQHTVSPCSTLLRSGVSAPADVVSPPDASLYASLRYTLSLEPNRTLALERELMSGDVSGRSSALVGVTVKRTDDAVASRAADCWGSASVKVSRILRQWPVHNQLRTRGGEDAGRHIAMETSEWSWKGLKWICKETSYRHLIRVWYLIVQIQREM